MLSPNHNHRIPVEIPGSAAKLTAGKITLDLSTTLGEYSGLENTPLSPPLKFIEVTAGHFLNV